MGIKLDQREELIENVHKDVERAHEALESANSKLKKTLFKVFKFPSLL